MLKITLLPTLIDQSTSNIFDTKHSFLLGELFVQNVELAITPH